MFCCLASRIVVAFTFRCEDDRSLDEKSTEFTSLKWVVAWRSQGKEEVCLYMAPPSLKSVENPRSVAEYYLLETLALSGLGTSLQKNAGGQESPGRWKVGKQWVDTLILRNFLISKFPAAFFPSPFRKWALLPALRTFAHFSWKEKTQGWSQLAGKGKRNVVSGLCHLLVLQHGP